MSQLSDLLSPATQAVLVAAQEIADQRHERLSSAHVAQALFDVNETAAHDLMRSAGVANLNLPVGTIRSHEEEIPRLIEQASQIAHNFRFGTVEPEHLLLAITQQSETAGHLLLKQSGSDLSFVARRTMEWLFGLSMLRNLKGQPNQTPQPNHPQPVAPPVQPPPGTWQGDSVLEQCGNDLTAAAAEGLVDPLIGREKELGVMIRTLLRRTKNNPLLIGDPGVGKTALVHGLAQMMINDEVPARLQGKRLVEVSTAALIAGTMYRGQFEERVRQLIAEVAEAEDVILFIDEIHTMTGTGGAEGSLDLANLLKPALASGELSVIGATTYEEFSRHFATDRALERRFQPIFVNEPSLKETERIARGVGPNLAEHHYVTILPEAVRAAVRLSDRYVRDRSLPDKALDLLDEAGAAASASATPPRSVATIKAELSAVIAAKTRLTEAGQLKEALGLRQKEQRLMRRLLALPPSADRPVITEAAIAQLISERTGIPLARVREEAPPASDLLTALRRQIIGQDNALQEISDHLARVQAGMRLSHQPLGSFVFLGPTGVGKTETARVLTRELFGSDQSLIKMDMSELSEKHSLSQLIGSPKGYVGHDEGGVLTDRIRRQPASVVLFDEIEKAHPDTFNILLQILEDGVVTDTHGRPASFNQALIVMTSNLGTAARGLDGGLGFVPADPHHDSVFTDALRDFFRPELLSRLSGVITFQPLSLSAVRRLTKRRLDVVRRAMRSRGFILNATPAAVDWLIERYDRKKGARSIDELIRRHVETGAVATMREAKPGRLALAVSANNALEFHF